MLINALVQQHLKGSKENLNIENPYSPLILSTEFDNFNFILPRSKHVHFQTP
jgi:hypothetical protein